MEATFFSTPLELRAWLEAHHAERSELLALCFGWIDGVRRGLNAESYTIRFTPRKPRSIWSRVNIDKIAELERAGLMTPAGRAAFERLETARSGVYSHEQEHPPALEGEQERRFREHTGAWVFFQAQPPTYRRAVVWWIVSAKRETTRTRRLEQAIAESAAERRLTQFSRPNGGSQP